MFNRKSFSFQKSYYESLRLLPKSKRLEVYEAVCEFALYGEHPKLKGRSAAMFTLIKPEIEAEVRRSEEVRRCSEYREWREKVFARDNFTCAFCGAHGVVLNAHHIKYYADCPELRYDINNGVTLCVECHKALHRKEREVRRNAK